ncbi:Zn-ribbon domain-containing OB-fold protein [Nocardia higoensis]|uniref:Zn-ribbon domain-containing OB-fold protein n=1 Tax=Nocardia higoensis TaxID=228599 RepID=UPI0002E38262|nr:OB-fold domain-containing protein [Nocardia higoensis]
MSPVRPLPLVTDDNRHHWSGSAQGWSVLRCGSCRRWLLPPAPVCRHCHADGPVPEPVSGDARLLSWTLNVQPWLPGMAVPFVVVLLALAEQDDLRLLTDLLDAEGNMVRTTEGLYVGAPLKIVFEQVADDVALPQATLAAAGPWRSDSERPSAQRLAAPDPSGPEAGNQERNV